MDAKALIAELRRISDFNKWAKEAADALEATEELRLRYIGACKTVDRLEKELAEARQRVSECEGIDSRFKNCQGRAAELEKVMTDLVTQLAEERRKREEALNEALKWIEAYRAALIAETGGSIDVDKAAQQFYYRSAK